MFEPSSRYYALNDAKTTAPDGRTITYKRRRFIPHNKDVPSLVEVTVIQGDRIDLITSSTLGDPEQFWRICDANNAMYPPDLIEPGRTLRVIAPQFQV